MLIALGGLIALSLKGVERLQAIIWTENDPALHLFRCAGFAQLLPHRVGVSRDIPGEEVPVLEFAAPLDDEQERLRLLDMYQRAIRKLAGNGIEVSTPAYLNRIIGQEKAEEALCR